MSSCEPVLRLDRLTIEVETPSGAAAVVDGLSLSVGAGSTLGLVGESGSGKSITCLSILGLLPKQARISGGAIWFKGQDLAKASTRAFEAIRGSRIGMILQDPMTSLDPLMRVADQIGEVFKYHHGLGARRERWKRAVEVMRQARITAPEERASAYPHQLSGGMRQRVAIATNIACDPELLIADEPTTALDAAIRFQILDLLKDIQRRRGTTIVLITHDLRSVARFCDDVAVMYAGRIVETGAVQDVFERPAHPYTVGLLAAVPRIASDVDRLGIIPGQPPRLGEPREGCSFAPRCARVQPQCRYSEPELLPATDGRRVACFFPEGALV